MRPLLTGVGSEKSFSLSVSGSSHEEHVFSSRGKLGKLIKSQALAFSCGNSVSGSGGEFKGDDSESFRDIEESVIVGDGSNECDNAFELVVFELRVAVVTKGLDNA